MEQLTYWDINSSIQNKPMAAHVYVNSFHLEFTKHKIVVDVEDRILLVFISTKYPNEFLMEESLEGLSNDDVAARVDSLLEQFA